MVLPYNKTIAAKKTKLSLHSRFVEHVSGGGASVGMAAGRSTELVLGICDHRLHHSVELFSLASASGSPAAAVSRRSGTPLSSKLPKLAAWQHPPVRRHTGDSRAKLTVKKIQQRKQTSTKTRIQHCRIARHHPIAIATTQPTRWTPSAPTSPPPKRGTSRTTSASYVAAAAPLTIPLPPPCL